MIKIATLFNIPINLHWSFLLLLGIVFARIALGGLPAEFGILYVVVFLLVLLHELGHSLMSKKLGYEVKSITLFVLGGAAQLQIPKDPKEEFLIASAGPAVNFILAILALVCMYIVGIPVVYETSLLDSSFPMIFITINMTMGLFNLLPIFPLDGGRIFRSILAYATKRHLLSTKIAVYSAQILSLAAMIYVVFFDFSFVRIMICVFVMLMSYVELKSYK